MRVHIRRKSGSNGNRATGAMVPALLALTCACTATRQDIIANEAATAHEQSWALVSSESPALGEVARGPGLPNVGYSGVSNTIPSRSSPTGGLQGGTGEEWQYDIALYAWFAGIDGSLATPSGLGVVIDNSFSDVLDSLDTGAMVYHEGRKGQWGYQVDVLYLDLSTETPGVTGDIDIGIEALIGEVDVTFSPRDVPSLQFLAGVRVMSVEQEVTLPIGPTGKHDETIVDPVLGAQGTWDIADRWKFRVRGDVGGFGVGSELTYQAFGFFGWKFAKAWNLDFGYSLLGYDIKKGDVNLDVQFHGPFVGVAYSF